MADATQAETEALLPCPFCGNAPNQTPQNDDCPLPGGNGYFKTICCERCGAEGGKRDADEKAIAAWNARAALPQPEVAPDDEALLQAHWRSYEALLRIENNPERTIAGCAEARDAASAAMEALRRRFAELRAVQDAGDAVNKALLAWLSELMDAKPDTPEMITLKRLSDIIEPYESVRWPIGKVMP